MDLGDALHQVFDNDLFWSGLADVPFA
jgi:hypothetical protein